MSPDKSLSRYILVILSVSVVFTALVIVALNAYLQNKQLSDPDNDSFLNTAFSSFSYEDGYKDGYLAAREKYSVAPTAIHAITGVILNKGENDFVLLGEGLDTDEIVDGISDERTVYISTSTTIVNRVELSPAEINLAMQQWQASGNFETESPPPAYKDTEVSPMDLEVGSHVTITALTDIRLEKEFTADNIAILIE